MLGQARNNEQSSTRDILNTNLRLPYPRLSEVSFFGSFSNESTDAKNELNVLTDIDLYNTCGTRIAFTSRQEGISLPPYDGLNLSYAVGDNPQNVTENIRILCSALGAENEIDRLIAPKQVHGDYIFEVDNMSKSSMQIEADSVLCTVSNIPVLLCFADCVPVILVAPTGSFAVVHSGWRGSIASISGKSLGKLACATGCNPSEINCYIGPHIGPCCYEVSGQLIKQFVARFGNDCDSGDNHLDLTQAVKTSLIEAGAQENRIADSGICTSCLSDSYFSYRAENGITGRHGAFAIRKEDV